MAVLVEAISVIVRRDSIAERLRGGWGGFESLVPNRTLCFDDVLARVGFMTPNDARAFIEILEAEGLVYVRNGRAIDIAVVDQLAGPAIPAPWLEYRKLNLDGMELTGCWQVGTEVSELAVPPGWNYERSMSANPKFAKEGTEGDHLKFLRRENGFDVYLDLTTDKEVYVGRPEQKGETPAALHTQLDKICHEALAIEAEIGPLKALADAESLAPRVKRLNLELLTKAKRIADGGGNELSLAHFTVGLILRIALEFEEAEERFRRANALQPNIINTLRELVLTLGEQGKAAEALEFARQAVDVAPADAGAWGNLAMCLIQTGQKEEARKAITHAVALDPQDPLNRTIRDNIEGNFPSEKDDERAAASTKRGRLPFRVWPLCAIFAFWPLYAEASGFDGPLAAISVMVPAGAALGVGLWFARKAYRLFTANEIGPAVAALLVVAGCAVVTVLLNHVASGVSFYGVSGREEPTLFALGLALGGVFGWFLPNPPTIKGGAMEDEDWDPMRTPESPSGSPDYRLCAFKKHSRFRTASGSGFQQFDHDPRSPGAEPEMKDYLMVLPLLRSLLEQEGFRDLSWSISDWGSASVLSSTGDSYRIRLLPEIKPHITGKTKSDGMECGIHVKISRPDKIPSWTSKEIGKLLTMDSEAGRRIFLAPVLVLAPDDGDGIARSGFRIDYRGLRRLLQGCQFE